MGNIGGRGWGHRGRMGDIGKGVGNIGEGVGNIGGREWGHRGRVGANDEAFPHFYLNEAVLQ